MGNQKSNELTGGHSTSLSIAIEHDKSRNTDTSVRKWLSWTLHIKTRPLVKQKVIFVRTMVRNTNL